MSDSAPAKQPPRLLDQVRVAIRLRHYSPKTEEAYVSWIRRFVLFHGKRHPREMGAAEVTAFHRIGSSAGGQGRGACRRNCATGHVPLTAAFVRDAPTRVGV